MPFFSVVIPLYNKEKFIEATLQSVLAQTFSNFEVLVIDDCSTDDSLSKVNQNDSRIRIIRHDRNKGLSAVRNTGIGYANASFIAFIDSDDTWKPFFLEKMHEMIVKLPNAGLYAAGYEEVYASNALAVQKNLQMEDEAMEIVYDFFQANSHQPIFCYSSVVIKKELFDNVGLFDETITLGEDVDFNIRANMKYQLAYYNRICAGYTIFSENQITNSSIGNKIVTDFDKYESWTKQHPSLKKYLDTNRYILAMHYKMAGENIKKDDLIINVDKKNLTMPQKLLLQAPIFIVKLLRRTKQMFLKNGIRLTTFKNE